MKQQGKQVNSAKVAELPTEKAETILTIADSPSAENVKEKDFEVLGSEMKRGLNLDETMKLIEELHLKKTLP